MYAYLYDPVLRQRSFRSFLERIERRLTDVGLGGKIYRLGPLLHLNEIVGEEQRRGTKTIVAVGNDRLFHQLVNSPHIGQFVVGFIPLNEHSMVGKLLGVPADPNAVTILSHRIVKLIPLATANAVRFFWELSAQFQAPALLIRCDDQYSVCPERGVGTVTVKNSSDRNYVTTVLETKQGMFSPIATSIFRNKKLQLSGMAADIRVDGQPIKVEKLLIQKLPLTLRVIVGRNRHEMLADVGATAGAAGALAMA